MSRVRIDWDKLDELLPTGLDPDSRKRRQKIFKRLETSGNKVLSTTEIDTGLRQLLRSMDDELRIFYDQALMAAFHRARNLNVVKQKKTKKADAKKAQDAASTVDKTEFHAFIVAFRKYLELATIFVQADESKDQKVCYEECKNAFPVLQDWGIDKLDLEFHFKYTERYSFEDFADWCIRESMEIKTGSTNWALQLDNSDNEEVQAQKVKSSLRDAAGVENNVKHGDECAMEQVADAFRKWDNDESGFITEDELTRVFSKLDPTMAPDDLKRLFIAADKNKDGKIDYKEFTAWLFQGLHPAL